MALPICYDEIDDALKTVPYEDLTVVDEKGDAFVQGRLEDGDL